MHSFYKKNLLSIAACILVSLVFIQYRVQKSGLVPHKKLMVTTWDAFGYYMYLPGIFIYDDFTQLKWLPEINREYGVVGGDLYQASLKENGNYVFKYLGGVAILEMPFFIIGHEIAKHSHYKADGFSPPYQYAIAFGAILYCILAIFLLRNILRRYFNDRVVALTILLLVLTTNLIQYVSIDGAMSHSFIFPLYVLILYSTIKWHEKPKIIWASLTGIIIGLAIICRPTELIMLFIPLFWNTQNKEASRAKWKLVRENRHHIFYAAAFGLIAIFPQLIYWKLASGSFIYNVGSKWVFLNPWFRVLFGFTNGWFIYTPITIFFIVGFFFIRRYPFRKSVLIFCLLNIWIVISWFDWKYGATFSTRALTQSYPIFSLPFAAFIQRLDNYRVKYLFYAGCGFLIFVNVVQLEQYNKKIIHFRDMNRLYYSRVYLDRNPSVLDMSLLDTGEVLDQKTGFKESVILKMDSTEYLGLTKSKSVLLAKESVENAMKSENWLNIKGSVQVEKGFESSYLACQLTSQDSTKTRRIRLFSPLNSPGKFNPYEFYIQIPDDFQEPVDVKIFIDPEGEFEGNLGNLRVSLLTK